MTFEAKAKDFKICPRGRPRELHLCYFALHLWHFGDFRNFFLPNIGEDQKKSYDFSSEPIAGTLARSQKFAMGEGCFGGLGAGPPVAGGQWGLGGRAPSPEAGVMGAETPALKNFAFFCKMNLIVELF